MINRKSKLSHLLSIPLLLILCSVLFIAITFATGVNSIFSYAYDPYGFNYTYYDSTYHITSSGQYERHYWYDSNYDQSYYDKVLSKATLESDGRCIENCYLCGGSRTIDFSWSLDEPFSQYNKSYNVTDHTTVYRKSKSITIWLDNAKPGSVLKVKIGKKKYSKKVGYKKRIKIKIKRPKYGSKVTIKVYYKGQVIGDTYWWDDDDSEYVKEDDEIVYYAKKIKKGMTKKQVKCLTDWGGPSDTASSSGGWSYWYYDDDSYIGFKRGKVKYWYDAAG